MATFKGYRSKSDTVHALYEIGVGGPVPFGKTGNYADILMTRAQVEESANNTALWEGAREGYRKVLHNWPTTASPVETAQQRRY